MSDSTTEIAICSADGNHDDEPDCCYLCERPLDAEHRSAEHLVPNAVGGFVTNDSLLCKPCNNTTGNELDAALCAQLNIFANLLDIKRDRGRPPDLRGQLAASGESVGIAPGGKPYLLKPQIKIREQASTIEIRLQAPNLKMARQALHGLKRKYPSIDVEELLRAAEMQSETLTQNVVLSSQFGGPDISRAATKSVINTYLHLDGRKRHIQQVLPYLKGASTVSPVCFWEPARVYPSSFSRPMHMVAIRGDRKQRILYGFAEYFSVCAFMVLLSRDYDGPDFDRLLAIDPTNRTSDENSGRMLTFHKNSIEKRLATGYMPTNAIKLAIDRFMSRLHNKENPDKLFEPIINEALAETWGKLAPDAIISKENVAELVSALMKRLHPMIARAAGERRLAEELSLDPPLCDL